MDLFANVDGGELILLFQVSSLTFKVNFDLCCFLVKLFILVDLWENIF